MELQPNKRILLALSGPIGAGKTTLALALQAKYGTKILRTRELILNRMPLTQRTRESLQAAGDELDDLTDHAWIREEVDVVFESINPAPVCVVLDSVRTGRQLHWLNKSQLYKTSHAHLYASPSELRTRFEERRDELDTNVLYRTVKANRHEMGVAGLMQHADLAIDTQLISPKEVAELVRDQLMQEVSEKSQLRPT